tara:strand:- start:127 stop:429 length:303 start_codon:yes stop_codon:yes gene_type:complete
MSDWKSLPSSRKVKKHPHGYLIVIPNSYGNPTPLECPVCEILMRDREDVIAYNNSKCCSYCELMWAYSNREEWDKGWRPKKSEIDRIRKQRMSSPTYTVS